MLLKDYYKMCHLSMLPKGMTKSVSYFTPRKSRVNAWPKVVNFGTQAFCKTWLIDFFNENFFNRPEEEVVTEYEKYAHYTMCDAVDSEPIRKLHQLGYLPIEIYALPEGTLVPMHCPFFAITNTHPDFAWLGQALESLISAELWYPMVCATVGHSYREIVDRYYAKTCEDNMPRRRALGNFDFRGDDGVYAALAAAGGWLLSFVNTATVPAIPYMEQNYNCDCTKEEVGFGAVSTEHFVMCSNSAFDMAAMAKREKETGIPYEYRDIDPRCECVFIKRALTELYPTTSFSLVADSYDYWNVVDSILPTLKDEILAHKGCMLVRGDSGDCVEVVTQTVFRLWDIFGGTVNSKGYKVLDSHVKALYGDSITIQRAEKIYKILDEAGFAACNVSLGVGSFSMHCIEESDIIDVRRVKVGNDQWFDLADNEQAMANVLKPHTRDTFSSAIKACYAEFTDEEGNVEKMPIYKDPKTDRTAGGGNFKKSQKGCCAVFKTGEGNGEISYEDCHTWDEVNNGSNLLVPIFRNGRMVKEETLSEIRQRLNNDNF